jgi:hypothetical protein
MQNLKLELFFSSEICHQEFIVNNKVVQYLHHWFPLKIQYVLIFEALNLVPGAESG